jgi:hypothetical protein
MTGHKLERRTFLKICGATVVGASLFSPLPLFAQKINKQKPERFKLSKPRWIIYENGSYDLISQEIILKNCRPAINGQGVMPKNVFLGDSPKGKRIVYELPEGFLMLDLKTNKDSISIGAELSGFSQAPRWFFPISQAEVFGVKRFYKQGLGTRGQSGVYTIEKSGEQNWGNKSGETSWSYDSYLAFAFLGEEETIAIGNVDHNDFLQRSTIYNRPHRNGLADRNAGDEQIFFEAAMLLEEIKIENDYIKLPELHFFTGNKPFETMQELTWISSEVSNARQSSITSYHWSLNTNIEETNSFDELKKQIDFLNTLDPKLPLHTLMINKGYCAIGDWLDPVENWEGGLDRAAREIFKDGYRAGIWLAPFAASENSKLFKQHPDWALKDFENKPIPEIITDEGILYAMDGSHPGFQKYLRKVFKTLRKTGFIFYETALMDWGLKDSWKIKRATPGKTSVQIYREVLQLIREEIGQGSLWIADQVPYGPTIGYADIVKVSNETNNGWDKKGVENMIQETYFTHYFNNIYWQNSPGDIDLLNTKNKLSEQEKISLALWKAILGGSVGTSDDMTKWNSVQLDFFRFLEPSKRQQNAFLPFWPDPDEIKVAVRVYKQQRSWGVLFFNDKDMPVDKSFDIFSLVEEESVYIFGWKPDIPIAFGELSEIQIILEPHQSKLFYFSRENEAPRQSLTLGGRNSDGLQAE